MKKYYLKAERLFEYLECLDYLEIILMFTVNRITHTVTCIGCTKIKYILEIFF